jgi:aldose 1-epimerase
MDIQTARVFTLSDGIGLTAQVMDLGATWLSCRVALPGLPQREVLLGHSEPWLHLGDAAYLGGIIGRYANRIAGARFSLDGLEYRVSANEGRHHLHGGTQGFNVKRWDVISSDGRELLLHLTSHDGDQGFPGALELNLRYCVPAEGVLRIDFDATCSAPCPVNFTAHPYFNLDGYGSSVLNHRLQIAADHYLPIDDEMIPLGMLQRVTGTPFDFLTPRAIRDQFLRGEQQRLAGGYDHSYVLNASCAQRYTLAAHAWSTDGRLVMSLHTSYPGLHFYSGNHLAKSLGRDGRYFAAHAGFALEPQYLPDSPNHPEWPQPSCILRPGQRMQHFIEYQFAPGFIKTD